MVILMICLIWVNLSYKRVNPNQLLKHLLLWMIIQIIQLVLLLLVVDGSLNCYGERKKTMILPSEERKMLYHDEYGVWYEEGTVPQPKQAVAPPPTSSSSSYGGAQMSPMGAPLNSGPQMSPMGAPSSSSPAPGMGSSLGAGYSPATPVRGRRYVDTFSGTVVATGIDSGQSAPPAHNYNVFNPQQS
eukprot:TRINITY_DN7573_c0_g1_i1.p1 TRINITY_DN7573_c0_g1~~TRINITY_DN7573_c0_g1_i1.p1  ORF type:complete len:187 (+),score=36.54 TRINITY_DN7573_c0_g1_i1:146-706(+)